MNYVLKYKNGSFVAESREGYPYPTTYLSSARMYGYKPTAIAYLSTLIRQFPNDHFDELIYQVTVSPV